MPTTPAALLLYVRRRSFGANRWWKNQKIKRAGKKRTDDKRPRQELLDELQQLRMENAYLKKLKALAQSDEPAHDTEPKSCKS